MRCEQKLSCPLVPTHSNKSITDARSICEQNHSVVPTDRTCVKPTHAEYVRTPYPSRDACCLR